jgi:hypothetical protein
MDVSFQNCVCWLIIIKQADYCSFFSVLGAGQPSFKQCNGFPRDLLGFG